LLTRLSLFLAAASAVIAGAMPDSPDQQLSNQLVEKYLVAQQGQREALRGVQMDIDIDAAIPKLEKRGKLHALRIITKLGRITYEALKFDGDNTVKKDVILRYLSTEAQAAERPDPDLAINPKNYKFKYKGTQPLAGREVHVLEVSPRRKAVGLFKGELWLDAVTCLPMREAGRFVKSPSVFLKRVEFVRDYEIKDGVAIPSRMMSYADTRIVGRTELNISYSNFTKQPDATEPPAGNQ
jgi:hypothetical protein